MYEKVNNSRYLLKDKESGMFKVLLRYSPENIMESNYYYKVSDKKYLDEIIDGAVGLSADKVKAQNDYNTIKWFRQFFMDEEILDFLNEEVCEYIAENDEDYMGRMQERIDDAKKEAEDYDNMREDAYRDYMRRGGRG